MPRPPLASLLGLSAFALGGSLTRAADPGAAAPFVDGDVVGFVGDSITHLGEYPAWIELFYATRFPHRRIQFYDCGISGDEASTIMARPTFRLDADVLSHQPTVATILLGANDVDRKEYGSASSAPGARDRQEQAQQKYRTAMVALTDRLQRAGLRVILLTPSIYDETARHPQISARFMMGGRGIARGVDAALGQFAQWLKAQASERQFGLVDFYGEMSEIDQREQKADPDFTVVSVDRLHPAAPGQFLMAYTLLKAQHLESPVAVIDVPEAGHPRPNSTCLISAVHRTDSTLAFDGLEAALPLVVDPAAQPALGWVPFAREFNRELLRVSGLPPGTYGLHLDGIELGHYSAAALAEGLNLADNPRTPQSVQAAAVAELVHRRMEVRLSLRAVAQNEYAAVGAGIDVKDVAALRRYGEKKRAALAAAGSKPDPRLAIFLQALASPGKLETEDGALAHEITQAAQPRPHHFELARVGP